MKQFIKIVIIGFTTFMIIRFVMLLRKTDSSVSDAVVETVTEPIKFIGNFLSLAIQPGKWGAASQIVTDHIDAAKQTPGFANKKIIVLGAYANIDSLVNTKPDEMGAEATQKVS